MHKLKIGIRGFLLISSVVGMLPCPAMGQRRAITMDEYITYEKDFLHVFFPELSGKKYWATFETSESYEPLTGYEDFGKNFLVDIGDGPKSDVLICCVGGTAGGVICPPSPVDKELGAPLIPCVPSQRPPRVEKPLNVDSKGAVHPYQYLRTAFNFDFEGRLTGFGLRERKEPGKLMDFWENLQLHPDMSDKEIMAAYKDTGAKYALGDRETFGRELPIEQLEQFLGELKILKLKFIGTGDERVDKLGGFSLCQVHLEGPGNRQYVVGFDAYTGELNLVHFLNEADMEFFYRDLN